MAQISNSIYYQPDSLSQLRRPDETISYSTRKVVPMANSKLDAFGQSTVNFKFATSANQYIMLDRSFIVLETDTFASATADEANVAGVAANGAIQPSVQKDIAPAYNLPDNLWSGYELKCGGFSLDNVNQNAPQISACIKRLQKSGAWVDRFGKSCEELEPSFAKRRAQISYDGRDYFGDSYGDVSTQLTGTIELQANGVLVGTGTTFLTEINPGDVLTSTNNQTFSVISVADNENAVVAVADPASTIGAGANCSVVRPSNVRKTAQASRTQHLFQPTGMGIWASGQALPPASYELVLRPFASPQYKQSALESKSAALNVSPSGVFAHLADMTASYNAEFNVRDIYLVLCVAERFERAPERQKIVFDIPTVNCQPRQIVGSGSSITESFTVSKSTYAFAAALQDLRAGTNTLYSPSKFIAGDNLNDQNKLTRFQISFDGTTRPSPEAEFQLTEVPNTATNIATLGVDNTKYWSYANRNINDLALYDSGGSFADYENSKELGLLQYYNWPRMGTSVSTAVDVRMTYSGAFDPERHNLLLFALSRRVVEMNLENGLVTSFVSQEA